MRPVCMLPKNLHFAALCSSSKHALHLLHSCTQLWIAPCTGACTAQCLHFLHTILYLHYHRLQAEALHGFGALQAASTLQLWSAGMLQGCIWIWPATTAAKMLQPFFRFPSSTCTSQSLHKQSLASSTLHLHQSCWSATPCRIAARMELSIAACSFLCR